MSEGTEQKAPAAAPAAPLSEEELAAKKAKAEQRKAQAEAAKAAKQAKFDAKKKAQEEAAAVKKEKDTKKKEEKKKEEPAVTAASTFVNTVPKGERKDMTGEMAATYSPPRVEACWYDWWERQGFFRPEYNTDPNAEKFVIVIPPPNVTGALHLGHALTNSIEDSIVRWHRMLGHKTLWVPGTDHAGISTQVVVEKKLMREKGLTRHDLGREAFVKDVWTWKAEYGSNIVRQLRRLGSSVDWEREAFTMDAPRERAVTEAFVRLHESGLIYRDNRLVNWCCTLKTAISDIEVEYIDLTEPTKLKVPGHGNRTYPFGELVHFAYKIEGANGEEVVCATTRIETMLADAAVAIHPEDPRYKHLHGKRVVHPFTGKTIPIICDPVLVDPKFGTGCVKVTPAHDPNDYECAHRNGLPLVNMFTPEGILNDTCGKFAGMKRFDARIAVIKELKELGLYRNTTPNPMRLAVCMRSKDIIEPRLMPQWYVKCKGMADRSVAAAREDRLKIFPESSRADWYRWLENIHDWCVSRQLWWGHRIPAYLCTVSGKTANSDSDDAWVVARSEAEALKKAAAKFGVAESEIKLEQDPDVLDTWFSSGLFPFSTMGWPDQTPDMAAYYPGTLLETGYDILFFWVARMVMMGLQLTDQLPFTNVFLHSMVRDAHGRKMSKTLGNVIDPIDVIEGITLEKLGEKLLHGNLSSDEVEKARAGQKTDFPNGIAECGTDAMRFALCAYTSQARDINLDINRVVGYRNFCNKIWNAVRFALMKLGADFTPSSARDGETPAGASHMDRWILSRLALTVAESNKGFRQYDLATSTTAIYSFWLYDLCDVYLEAVKPFVSESDAARQTLFTCVEAGLRLLHPFMPFVTEELWQYLPRRPGCSIPSIMVAAYPIEATCGAWASAELEAEVVSVMEIVRGIRGLNAPYSQDIKKSGKKPPAYVSAHSEHLVKLCNTYAATIKVLSYCGEFTLLDASAAEPGWAVGIVSKECEVYSNLEGIIDPKAETAKLEKRMEKIGEELRPLIARRADPLFESKTPADVRQQMIEKIAALEEELSLAKKAVERLALMK